MTSLFNKGTLSLVFASLITSGCTVTPENAYAEATNASECQALHQVALTRAMQDQASSGIAGLDQFARSLFNGFDEGSADKRLASCLTRVSGAQFDDPPLSGGLAPIINTAPESIFPAQNGLCKIGYGIFVRGDMYCVGNL